jgi:hypothetical protein
MRFKTKIQKEAQKEVSNEMDVLCLTDFLITSLGGNLKRERDTRTKFKQSKLSGFLRQCVESLTSSLLQS